MQENAKTTLTPANGETTLSSIKAYIYNEKGKLDGTMIRFLFDLAERAYELKGTRNPRMCGISFVSATITNAQRR